MNISEWLALIAIIVAIIIGVMQIVLSRSGTSTKISQRSGLFSKTKQSVKWKDSDK
ncbi:hypothetical protein AE1304_19480 [Aeromonas enteropelogenes]